MKRVMLTVAYDGTNYCGWQVQPKKTTVQGILNEKLSILLKEDIAVIGASRTDSGVHAYGNVAVFDTNTLIPSDKISYAINQHLPGDIVVQNSREVTGDFHPRHCNCIKTYEYSIYNAPFPNPIRCRYSHFVYYSFDIEAMQQAAVYFLGEHDFKSFCSAGSQVKDTVRRIDVLEVMKNGKLITIRIKGNGFLYNMVRIIAGTLMQVGKGHYLPEHVKDIIDALDRHEAGPTAPAKGLTLVEIIYDEGKV